MRHCTQGFVLMRRPPVALFLAGLLLMVAGCGLARGNSWDPFRSTSERQILIRIQNNTLQDVFVDAMSAGQRSELGLVSSRSSAQHRISWSRVEDLRFRISPIGGRPHTTAGLSVGPGDRVELVVQSPLNRSFVRR